MNDVIVLTDLKINTVMKNLSIESFAEFALTNEEMINVRGGRGFYVNIAEDSKIDPTKPPIVIIET